VNLAAPPHADACARTPKLQVAAKQHGWHLTGATARRISRRERSAVDDYRPASIRSLLIVLVAVVIAIAVIWIIAGWGLNVTNAPDVERMADPAIPGVR